MLQGTQIGKVYAGRPVLDGIDVAVKPGGITAIVGPSGGGKTTLLRALALVTPPDTGTVRIDEREYRFPGAALLPPPWPRVTAVFQQLFLWPHLTLRQNIALPLQCAGKPSEEAIERLSRKFAMEPFLDRHPNQVSGGQRQRAALARALALEPRYLLLDEITSALDVEQARILFDHLGELKREGVGILLITHYLGFVREAADSVLFLEHGQAVEQGGREILSAPRTERLRRFLAA
jgi:polar amino acid transport system ATP-binding protein